MLLPRIAEGNGTATLPFFLYPKTDSAGKTESDTKRIIIFVSNKKYNL